MTTRYSNSDDQSESNAAPVERAFERAGAGLDRLRERMEMAVSGYKVLRTFGLTDVDIAKIVVKTAADRTGEELGKRVNPDETRRVFDEVENTMFAVVQETDARLGFNGDLIRTMHEASVYVRAGREDAITGIERSMAQGRELLRRLTRDETED